jgi:hypothetical protein
MENGTRFADGRMLEMLTDRRKDSDGGRLCALATYRQK